MKTRRLQSTVLIGIALLIAVAFVSLAQTADHPAAATGIGLQTLAGLFAAVQLWANSASDVLVNWVARQIDSNRWHLARLLDGRLRSLAIATGWAVGGFFCLGLPGALDPPPAIFWLLAVAVVALALTGAIAFCLALFMCAGAYFLDGVPLPDGEASTALQARLANNNWVWPLVAFAFLVGGILQIAAV